MKAFLFSLTLTLALFGPSDAAEAQCLDQFQLDGSDQNQVIHSSRTVGETFAADHFGRLAGIEVSIYAIGLGGPDDLMLEVLDATVGDLSAAPVLGSITASEGDLGPSPTLLSTAGPKGTYFDLSALGIQVKEGDKLAFRFSTTRVLPSSYLIRISLTDDYTEGVYFVDDVSVPSADAAFKTFFDVTAAMGFFFGSGINPPVLDPGPLAPVIGGPWEPLLLAPLTPFDVARFLAISFPGPVIPFGAYEILCQFPAITVLPIALGLNPISIPDDCSIVGVALRAQAFSTVGGPTPGVALSNAVELLIGNN